MVEAIPEAKQQSPYRLRVLLAQCPLEIGPDEGDVCGERFLKEGVPFLSQLHVGTPAVARHIVAPDQALRDQTIEHAGERPFRDQGLGGEFGTGHAVRISQRCDHIELRWCEPHRANVSVVDAQERRVDFDQRPEDFQVGVVFQLGKIHAERE